MTITGLTFTSALDGHFYALDTQTGKELWTVSTGSAIVSPRWPTPPAARKSSR